MKIRPKVFEDAMQLVAESQAVYFSDYTFKNGCCDSIIETAFNSGEFSGKYTAFFEKLFDQFGGYYWPLYEEGYTSRIIALQLAACVARDENKRKL